MQLHLDTDIGSDIDDLCALAMVLGWPGVELVGITTAAESGGKRAGYVNRALELAGREGVPVAAGVDIASGRFRYAPGYPPDDEYWGGPVEPRAGPAEAAIELLRASIEAGAVVVAVGPWTNLAELERRHAGSLAAAQLVVMGGSVAEATREEFPPWGAEEDYNVYMDVAAAEAVLASSHPVVVPLGVTVQTSLRRAYLPRLRRAGPLGELLARQAEAYARDNQVEERWGRAWPGLPDDTLNFLHDPLACAIALGWREGVRIDRLPLRWERRGQLLHEWSEPGGKPTHVVTGIDPRAFEETWLGTIEGRGAAQRRAERPNISGTAGTSSGG